MAPVKALGNATINFPTRKLRSGRSKANKATDKENVEQAEEGNRLRTASLPPARVTALREASPTRSPSRSPTKTNKSDVLRSPAKNTIQCSPRKTAPRSPLKALQDSPSRRRVASPLRLQPQEEQCSPRKSPRKILSEVQVLVGPLPLAAISSPKKGCNSAPVTPRAKKQLFRRDTSAYSAAKNALSTALPEVLIGRKDEMAAMEKFLSEAWSGRRGVKKSLYVSGAPGTGKTASLSYLLKSLKMDRTHQVVFINCMSLKSSKKVFADVARGLDPAFEGNETAARKNIEATLCAKGKPVLIVLDEVDQLGSKDQEVLYTLFELPHLKGSRSALVGIANALDLTDRTLPRLKAAVSVAPTQLSFPAYTKSEIHDIIASRLRSAASSEDAAPIIKPAAVKFLAGKISSLSGDIRKALDVCRRAIELAEIEYRKQAVLKADLGDSGELKQIDLGQILKIFNEVYSSRVSASLKDANSDLPLQQKLLMATLLLMSCYGGRKCKEVSLGKLHESHSRVCKKRSMSGLDVSEVQSMCALLEARGFFALRKGKSVRETKVSLRIDEQEVEQALQDKTLLTAILKDTSCIAK